MTMMMLRQWHGYLGVLIAPSVLFFALTGSLQLFSLHESHGAYRAPEIFQKLGSLHKDQVLTPAHHHEAAGPGPKSSPAPQADDDHDHDSGPPPAVLLLKAFFLIVAVGLITSTLAGLWIAFTRKRDRRLTWLLLAAGVVIPVALIVV